MLSSLFSVPMSQKQVRLAEIQCKLLRVVGRVLADAFTGGSTFTSRLAMSVTCVSNPKCSTEIR